MATVARSAIAEEYRALTEGCGLLDRSERGKLALTGADAAEFLNGQVTNDTLSLRPGEGCYAAFLTHKGKMLGDLRVLAAGDGGDSGGAVGDGGAVAGGDGGGVDDSGAVAGGDGGGVDDGGAVTELLLDTERVALQDLFDMIRRFSIGYRVELHKRTLESALLSLVGPRSDEVAAGASDEIAAVASAASPAEQGVRLADAEHAHLASRVAGRPVRLIRTDRGIDVLCDSGDSEAVGNELRAAGAATVSEEAAEIVRVESGRPRYGVDIDSGTIPQEAGLNERAVSFTKGCYVGQETVARLHYKGKPNRLLRGLRLSEPVAAGAPLLLGEREVGRLSSVAVSPRLGPIGLALVRVQAEPGSALSVGDHPATAVVSDLPFAAQ